MNEEFPSTEWSELRTLHDGTAADVGTRLSRLCALYWLPLYCFLRRAGVGPEEARELATRR